MLAEPSSPTNAVAKEADHRLSALAAKNASAKSVTRSSSSLTIYASVGTCAGQRFNAHLLELTQARTAAGFGKVPSRDLDMDTWASTGECGQHTSSPTSISAGPYQKAWNSTTFVGCVVVSIRGISKQ